VATWPYFLFAVAAGVMLPFQFGVNSVLARCVDGAALASLTVDHLGPVGFHENPITPGRLLGLVLVAAGVVLVRGL
jgi:transporter family-2 protein